MEIQPDIKGVEKAILSPDFRTSKDLKQKIALSGLLTNVDLRLSSRQAEALYL